MTARPNPRDSEYPTSPVGLWHFSRPNHLLGRVPNHAPDLVHRQQTNEVGRKIRNVTSPMADNWITPKWLLDLLFRNRSFYDPCPIGGSGGLESDWPIEIPVFVNPPYSDREPWCRKASQHEGPVFVLHLYTPSVAWFNELQPLFQEIVITQPIIFRNTDTGKVGSQGRVAHCIWWRNDG